MICKYYTHYKTNQSCKNWDEHYKSTCLMPTNISEAKKNKNGNNNANSEDVPFQQIREIF